MPEAFLILLAGGVLLAAAVSNPRLVTVHWLRLCGILALAFAGLAVFFVLRREGSHDASLLYRRIQLGLLVGAVVALLAHLAFVQTLFLRVQRAFAGIAFVLAVMVGAGLIHKTLPHASSAAAFAKPQAVALQTIACVGVAALPGLVLMDMLLGHAYLTAAKMTIAPFRRLNFALLSALLLRIIVGIAAIVLQSRYPTELFWQRFGLLVSTRWLVGLIIPVVFAYMAHDCIKRRSTQSATGILYVAGVLIFIGEMIALYLTRETGLPF
jgi:hypothetical protein